jgi:dolichol-phosphate mannosyltransferase
MLDIGPPASLVECVDPEPMAPGLTDRTARSFPVQLSIIVPTYNESANLKELTARVVAALSDVAWEMIIVDDDSPDRTAAKAQQLSLSDHRIRVIRRIGRRGLSSACIEGMLSSSAPFLAVMDGDLQHDPALLPNMLHIMRSEATDLVIASRHVDGGSLGDWSEQRVSISRFATQLARHIAAVEISDPMSGYFMLRREIVDDHVHNFTGTGFKILLDIVLSCKGHLRISEVPLVFGIRSHGESKLSINVCWEYLMLLVDKTIGRILPSRFVAFGLIGSFGVVIHMTIVSLLVMVAGMGFLLAQTLATVTAIAANFTINNLLTYADRSLKGWRWLSGLASFAIICGVGALANIGVANLLFGQHTSWPLAALAGIVASAVWNYGVSAHYTWGVMR